MAENIDKSVAKEVLLSAFRSRCAKNDEIAVALRKVLAGSHKTYKYILMTALLAKASNTNIDPLALQAGAPLKGAYDARSLCHQVLVRFERDFLHNALGGSNEPFLNKPARFTHLSSDNAVRRGKDRAILELLISTLPKIKGSEDAKGYLACALEFLNQYIKQLQVLHKSEIQYEPTLIEVYEFIYRFLGKSFEGATSVIIVGALEKLFYSTQKNSYRVVVHKVNQSGASSKEVGDIDVYKGKVFQYAIEVKDKRFTAYDLGHAFEKMRANKAKRGQFIYGPNIAFEEDPVNAKIKEFERKGFMVMFLDVYTYSRFMLFKMDLTDKKVFAKIVMEVAIEINATDAVKKWIQSLLSELSWK